MAEGFEPYHVPQQSRRDKLRVAVAMELHGLMTQLPQPIIDFSGGSSSPSDLVTCNNPMEGPVGSSSSLSLRNPYASFDPSIFCRSSGDQVVVLKPEPLSLSLSSFRNDNDNGGDHFGNEGDSRVSAPMGPFTGYASVLKGSRFLRPAQHLLEELCCDVVGGIVSSHIKLEPDSSLMLMDSNLIVEHLDRDDDHGHDDGYDDDFRTKKSKLISMLDEVYRRYKQYYQQMQAVVTSFDYVAGIGNAAPYANLAVETMTRHFKCLKNAIMDQLHHFADNHTYHQKKSESRVGSRPSLSVVNNVYGQRSMMNHHIGSGFVDHQPVWRPQRGLPERAVTVLRAWLFEHFLHPYPTDTDKVMLAKQTGLSRSQVSNWFINARVRLWKPMVEEIHMLETRNTQKGLPHRSVPSTNSNDNSSVALTSKRSRCNNEDILVPTSDGVVDAMNGQLAARQQVQVDPTPSGVSLTLGLHQDGGIYVAQRFAGSSADGFGFGGTFDSNQNRHFGGQLLRDFVG